MSFFQNLMLPVLFLLLAGGFVFLIFGADYLVKGSASLAKRFGLSTLVIGLTVVAFGTSAPELAINLLSAGTGEDGLALGNIFGSNIANILLILGVSALISPIVMSEGTVWKEIPLSLLAAVFALILGADAFLDGDPPDALTRIDGLVLLAVFLIFLYYSYGISKAESDSRQSVEAFPLMKSLFFIGAGLAALIGGGFVTVEAAKAIAFSFGIPSAIIGATVVAVGTSLPELATAVVAARKGHPEIAVGNVVGSNIFNILFVLGSTAMFAPLTYTLRSFQDVAIVIGVSVVLFVAMFVGARHTLRRDEGMIFLALYAGYIGFNVLQAM